MPNYQDIGLLGATIINVGTSAIVKVSPSAYQYASFIKIYAGGSSGTLEIVPPIGTLSGAGAAGWSLGYPIATNESVFFDGPATFYLAAMGVTMRVAMGIGYSQGATIVNGAVGGVL